MIPKNSLHKAFSKATNRYSEAELHILYEMGVPKDGSIKDLDYGVERCLYELDPGLSCLSPHLLEAKVLTPKEALLALENLAQCDDRPSFPIDSHLSAFFLGRFKGVRPKDLRDLEKNQREIKNLAALRVFADIQDYFKVEDLPHLSRWMAELCDPLLQQYKNVLSRHRLQKELHQAIISGQLSNLVKVFENPHDLDVDDSDYQAAQIDLLLIESEIKEIKGKIQNRNRYPLAQSLRKLISLLCPNRETRRLAKLYQREQRIKDMWGDSL